MSRVLILLTLLCAGCGDTFRTGLGDSIHAMARDCSVVRWDRGQGFCRAEERPPDQPAFCSRSLAGVDCWADPAGLVNKPRPLADGPRGLTDAQEAHRTRVWPRF